MHRLAPHLLNTPIRCHISGCREQGGVSTCILSRGILWVIQLPVSIRDTISSQGRVVTYCILSILLISSALISQDLAKGRVFCSPSNWNPHKCRMVSSSGQDWRFPTDHLFTGKEEAALCRVSQKLTGSGFPGVQANVFLFPTWRLNPGPLAGKAAAPPLREDPSHFCTASRRENYYFS